MPTSKEYLQAIKRAYERTTGLVEKDLRATTRTWDHQPKFRIETQTKGGDYSLTAGTDDLIYLWVSEGTKSHPIAARRSPYLVFQGGYRRKTRVNVIGSQEGGRDPEGEWFRKKQVKHPGFPGRNFILRIQQRRQVTLRQQTEQAIAEVNRLQK